jgi:hypothetical protein
MYFFPLKTKISRLKNSFALRNLVYFSSENCFWTEPNLPSADKLSMKLQGSFKEILREKMSDFHPIPPLKSTPEKLSLDPIHMAFLLGNVQKRMTQCSRGSYPQSIVRPQRKPHVLTATQRHSYEFLKSWVRDLSEGFSSVELKKAFRRAAKILHPDSGGNAILFMDLKAHYECLRSVIGK